MIKIILPMILCLGLSVFPSLAVASVSPDRDRGHNNYHRGNNGNRGTGGDRGHNKGNDNRGNNRGGFSLGKGDKKDHDNKKHDNHRPGNGNNRPGNDKYRPGNGNNKPGTDKYRPGYGNGNNKPRNPRPGYGTPPPGHNRRPVYNVSRPAYRPHHVNKGHYPRLSQMIRYRLANASDYRVWQVGPDVYMVRYLLGGTYYMQSFYPVTGTYGTAFPVVLRNGRWYDYDDYEYWDDGNVLRISFNGSPLNPWTLVPSIQLNLSL